ncbi:MAG: prephenate dehydratase domain-containing protein [bacterium]
MMNKIIIGVSGGVGSFSEEAANYYCQKNKITGYELKYLISVENVLASLDNSAIDQGVFPIENSNGGIVVEAVYAMAKHQFEIKHIFEIDIRHNLLARKNINPSEISAIASHQQALKQCRMYLKRKWADVELIEYKDTAEAARDIAEGRLSPSTAVIANRVCADMYDLEILEEGIQDLKFNFTSFIVATK